jgi:hypothetical protein
LVRAPGTEWRGLAGIELPADRGDEPIAPPRQRLDESRHVRRIAKRLSQPANRGIQAALEVDERLWAARAFQQRPEDLEGLVGETDPDAALAQLARAQIQLERAEPNEIIRVLGHAN